MGMFTSGYYDKTDVEVAAEEKRKQQWRDSELDFGPDFLMDERIPTSICRECHALVPGNHYTTNHLSGHRAWHRSQNA